MFHVDPAEPLSEHGAVAACCHGDLDLGGRTTLLDALATTSAATTASPPTIVLDLARISFIDAAGLVLSFSCGNTRPVEVAGSCCGTRLDASADCWP